VVIAAAAAVAAVAAVSKHHQTQLSVASRPITPML